MVHYYYYYYDQSRHAGCFILDIMAYIMAIFIAKKGVIDKVNKTDEIEIENYRTGQELQELLVTLTTWSLFLVNNWFDLKGGYRPFFGY